jgi:hypothetical protein
MRPSYLNFDLENTASVKALATMIRQLNAEGVPYSLKQSDLQVTMEISTGF